MPKSNSCVFCWSGGKDSALALYKILNNSSPDYHVKCLFTTLSEQFRRVSMHGIRRSLLVAQAESIGIPLRELYLPEDTTLETYGRLMGESWNEFKKGGTNSAVFGDIFLEDLRKYREEQLQKAGIETVFPLWKIDTEKLAKQFIEYGFRSIVTCVDGQKLDRSFAGRLYDRSFLEDLPADVDPCGEIGEFHSFVFDGPIFEKPVDYSVGEIVHKNYKAATGEVHSDKGYWFTELIPGVET